MRPESQAIIHLDNKEMVYPADMMVILLFIFFMEVHAKLQKFTFHPYIFALTNTQFVKVW